MNFAIIFNQYIIQIRILNFCRMTGEVYIGNKCFWWHRGLYVDYFSDLHLNKRYFYCEKHTLHYLWSALKGDVDELRYYSWIILSERKHKKKKWKKESSGFGYILIYHTYNIYISCLNLWVNILNQFCFRWEDVLAGQLKF